MEVQYTYQRNGKLFLVNKVPCERCEYCGEEYFKADVLKNIEKAFDAIYSKGKKVKTELVVPVEQYAKMQAADQ